MALPAAMPSPRHRVLAAEFLRFGAVGTAGFAVDAGVLTALMAAGLGPLGGRVGSYLAAATATWALNRAWTFRHRAAGAPVGRQWLLFLGVNLVGFAVNFGTYAALLATVPAVARHPVLGVAAGALVGMTGNFLLSRRYVFRAPDPAAGNPSLTIGRA